MNRNRIILVFLGVAVALVTVSWSSAAETQPATSPAGLGERIAALKHLRIDLKNRQIVVDAEVCLRSGPLELLLCKWGTKDYESILRTRAAPSDLHAALLAMGLRPGKPARWSAGGDEAEARFLPPQGPALKIMLLWKDAAGKPRRAEAGKWLGSAGQNKTPSPETWIFVGSQVLPEGRYWADVDGDVISVANFASSVIDVPFKSSDKNALLEFIAATDAIPPMGTKVQVLIAPMPNAERAAHARVMLEIDRFGRLRLDGKPVLVGNLTDWARNYIARHAKGQVVIRADARALAWDVEQARVELRLGGLRDVSEQVLPPSGEILPRTPAQARQSLQWWAEQFADVKNLITDPVHDARALLRQIDAQRRRLEAMKAMWGEYAIHIRRVLAKYEASTQPANKSAAEPGK